MNPTEKLQELFLKFPGIGPKQASRFVYFLLREDKNYKTELAKNIEYLKESAQTCERCLRIFGKVSRSDERVYLCDICEDQNRDQKSLMIVIKELDIDAIEKTNLYTGKYFVLGSTLPFLTEKPSEVIHIRELVKLISENLSAQGGSALGGKNNLQISEIILAIPATDEGDHTIDYLEKTLAQIVGIQKVKKSRLARGLSTGLDLEYVDRNTFQQAFQHRNPSLSPTLS